MQRWGASTLSRVLAGQLHTKIEIDRLRLGIFNRVVLDGVRIYDRKDSLMLNVARMAAKMDPIALTDGQIRIDGAQLFGTHAHLYRDSAKAEPNFQFVLDAFQGKDTTSKPINLAIGRFLVRHANVRYDQLDRPLTPGRFNPHHIHIRKLGFNASVRQLTPDSINATLRRVSFKEQSGFELTTLNFDLHGGSSGALLENLQITLPRSEVTLPRLSLNYVSLPQKGHIEKWIQEMEAEGKLSINFCPADIAMFVPQLRHWTGILHLNTDIHASRGTLALNRILLHDDEHHFRLEADAIASHLDSINKAHAEIHTLRFSKDIQNFITKCIKGEAGEISPLLTRLGEMQVTGKMYLKNKHYGGRLTLDTELGSIHLETDLSPDQQIQAFMQTEHFRLGKLLGGKTGKDIGHLSTELEAKGWLKGKDNKPVLNVDGIVRECIYKGHTYRNLNITGHYSEKEYRLEAALDDPMAQLELSTQLHLEGEHKKGFCSINAGNIDLHGLNLTKKLKGERISLNLNTELSGNNWENLQGKLTLQDICLQSDTLGTLRPGNLLIDIHPEEGDKFIQIESTPLNARIRGGFKWKNLKPALQKITAYYLPTLIPAPAIDAMDDITFSMEVQDSTLVHRITGANLCIPEKTRLEGRMSGEHNLLHIHADIPHIKLGGEELKNVELHIQSSPEMLQSTIGLNRMMKGTPIQMGVNAYIGYDKVRTTMHWDNGQSTRQQKGEIKATGIFFTGRDGKPALHTRFTPSDIIISDTTWVMHPSIVEYHDGVMDVMDFGLSQAERYLKINGRVSGLPQDSLAVQLNRINLEYIFRLINFNAVEFAGNATGYVYARQLLNGPMADAFLNVSDFTFNNGQMGSMDIHAGWNTQEKRISLDAHIQDPEANQQTTVKGTITPGRGTKGGLDLRIDAKRINLFFLNKFTDGIFEDFQGRATGWARIFGPFKKIDIEGDLVADEAALGVKMLGARYSIYGDSIQMRPGHIRIKHATAYDHLGVPGQDEHSATVDGHLMHDHFKNLRYNFSIQARNVLGYNFRDFGDLNFYGTVYATGHVQLSGQPGTLQVDINATPLSGTQFVYNVTSPETLTEAGFITYVSRKDSTAAGHTATNNNHITTKETEEEENKNDIYLNFDLNLTPEAGMRLLMDPKSGDYITLAGNGRIRAHYHNKGKFRMYGIYNVDHGVYKLSLQDFIRKDFTFRKNGSITFGGDAYQAALNLQAVYTVPNVSLDDLSATSLGLSNTRVDCVMNITGKPSAPVVSFDFDLPNANEDEKQMVRSMVSTEEEKNMQAIYLLGIGRFYNYNAQYMPGSTNQSSTAMNSLISSTLSSQFNQMMSQMVGNSNWSFGANLRTGETGWEELDVEGMLSGRFLNNRLLFNGNFGYRESVYSNNNFIGDFDVQYLLTPTGTIALKAYNETNDRYFIQSSLTTQGIGIQFKKDFNRWKDLFLRKNRKKKEKKK